MTKTLEHTLTRLHAGLTERPRPEDVLRSLEDTDLLRALPADLRRSAANLADVARSHPTIMSKRYRRHPGLAGPFETASALVNAVLAAADAPRLATADPTDAESLDVWVTYALERLHVKNQQTSTRRGRRPAMRRHTWTRYTDKGEKYVDEYFAPAPSPSARTTRHNHADFRNRLNSQELAEALPGVSPRMYRAAVRSVLHLQERTRTLAARQRLERLIAFGKSRAAGAIPVADFVSAPHTAAFIAYYTARMGLRTHFTGAPQARPMDTVAEGLLQLALPEGRFDLLAHVLLHSKIVERLSEEKIRELFDLYNAVWFEAALTMSRLFDEKRDRRHMVTRRGDDSSTWNAASRAFNQVRTGMLCLARHSPAVAEALDTALPGKVPTLVASDIQHHLHETAAHPDTEVWATLPLPWDVLFGVATCTPADVAAACEAAGLDPAATGWTSPYRQDDLEESAATAETVHGVVVDDALSAKILKDLGAFSGRAA